MAAALRAVFRRTPPAARLELASRPPTARRLDRRLRRRCCRAGGGADNGSDIADLILNERRRTFPDSASARRSSGATSVIACPTSSARPVRPDAVHVGVGRIGHLVVDDRVDAVDVEAARGDVGGDEHLVLAAPESFDRDAPLILACGRRAAPTHLMPAAASLRASRSAPIFVREKISTGPSGRRRCSISQSTLSCAGDRLRRGA